VDAVPAAAVGRLRPLLDGTPLDPKATGWRRLSGAVGYTVAGLRHAFRHEAAFRQELLACGLLIPLATLLPASRVERLVLVLSMLLVVMAELFNSAIEATVDRISFDRHPLSGRAKDLGSAAVAVALLMSALCWLVVGGPVLLQWWGR
jgi:diacylglycerol kinase (ATP)